MEFWKGVFTDGGSPSFSRVASGVALAFVCGWVTAIVYRTHAIPELNGVCLFIGTLYGTNSALNAFKSFGEHKEPER
jgi:hypothetical protein